MTGCLLQGGGALPQALDGPVAEVVLWLLNFLTSIPVIRVSTFRRANGDNWARRCHSQVYSSHLSLTSAHSGERAVRMYVLIEAVQDATQAGQRVAAMRADLIKVALHGHFLES